MRFNLVKLVDAIADARAEWFGADARLALVMLGRHADENGISFPSQRLVGEEMARVERTAHAALKTLERHGIVEVVAQGRQHASTRYSVLHAVERLKAACDAALDELRAAPDAALDGVSPAPRADLPNRQTRKRRHPDPQTTTSRPARRAAEGTQEGTQEGTHPVGASGATPLQLEIVEAKTKSEHQQLVAHYATAYERTHDGAKPEIRPADGKRAKELLAKHGLIESRRIVDAWFADNFRAQRQPSLRQIDANAARSQAANARPGVQMAPEGGSAWDREGGAQ